MFDLALHFRFLEKATEAFFELSQASVAASLAWQSRLNDEFNAAGGNAPAANIWSKPEAQRPSPVHIATPMDPAGAWQAAADGCAAWKSWFETWANQTSAPPTANFASNWFFTPSGPSQSFRTSDPTGLAAAMTEWQTSVAIAMWNATPRSFYQAPLMAMMLSYGVPYSVAAPASRASTSAMDAADAACAQWRLMLTGKNERMPVERLMASMAWPASIH